MPGPRTRSAIVVMMLLAAPALPGSRTTAAEPQVHQGETDPQTDAHVFRSPMVIETELKAALPENLGKWTVSNEFEEYVCDTVHLESLETRLVPKKAYVQLTIRAATYTEPGHDKKVGLDFELVEADQVLVTGTMPPFSSEEKKWGAGTLTIRIPTDKWPPAATPTLRITMRVVND